MQYEDYILNEDVEIIRQIQTYCADLWDAHGKVDGVTAWDYSDAEFVAMLFNKSASPTALFRFMDEKTGSHYVGYKTRDGREWFHILRQMRNTRGSGLLENLGR